MRGKNNYRMDSESEIFLNNTVPNVKWESYKMRWKVFVFTYTYTCALDFQFSKFAVKVIEQDWPELGSFAVLAGFSFRDRVRSLDIPEEFRVQPLLLRIWLGSLPDLSLERCFPHTHPGGDPGAVQQHVKESICFDWLGNAATCAWWC